MLVRLDDAGGGAGTWQVQLEPQAATAGASVDVPGLVAIPPGGEAVLPVVAHAAAGAVAGENYGFVVLRKGAVTRRIPYLFLVSRPALAAAQVLPLRRTQTGDTRSGTSRVERVPLPGRAVRERPGRAADGAGRGRARVRDHGRASGRERRRVDPRQQLRRANRHLVSRSPRREHRAGIRRHAGRRQQLHIRLPPAGRRGRRRVPAAGAVLRQRRLRPQPFHREECGGQLRAPFVGRRRNTAVTRAADNACLDRAPDARLPRAGHAIRRRRAVAGDRLQGCARGRSLVRPRYGHRSVSAPELRPGACGGNDPHPHDCLRLPGGQEHRHDRPQAHAQHELSYRVDACRRRAGRGLARAAERGLREGLAEARRRGERPGRRGLRALRAVDGKRAAVVRTSDQGVWTARCPSGPLRAVGTS